MTDTCDRYLAWQRRLVLPVLFLPLIVSDPLHGDESSEGIAFQNRPGQLTIVADGEPIAAYVYEDANIPRPYFAHVKAPCGCQVTRNHPPVEGQDRSDHATMHPGIWMAFGDLGGSDFWRNRANIVHQSFVEEPVGGPRSGMFTEEKHYVREDGTLVCGETFRCSIHIVENGYLLTWDSTFHSDEPFWFGDQEEMGLGFRVATPIAETSGGRLRDSRGRAGAAAIWSNASDWCDYSGTINGHRVGMTLLCHPDNFRPSWMHARNYGLLVANPFGREAMRKGETSRIVIQPGEKLRLRYGIWIHGGTGNRKPDCADAFARYLTIAR